MWSGLKPWKSFMCPICVIMWRGTTHWVLHGNRQEVQTTRHLQFRPLLHLFPSLRPHHPTQNLECQQYLLKSALGNQWHKVSSVWVFIWFSVEQLVHLPNSCTKIMLQLLLHLLVIYTGLRKVTDDMKSKNRTDKTGVVAAEGKETRNAPSFSSTKGPAKLELQMGRK